MKVRLSGDAGIAVPCIAGMRNTSACPLPILSDESNPGPWSYLLPEERGTGVFALRRPDLQNGKAEVRPVPSFARVLPLPVTPWFPFAFLQFYLWNRFEESGDDKPGQVGSWRRLPDPPIGLGIGRTGQLAAAFSTREGDGCWLSLALTELVWGTHAEVCIK